MKVLSFCFCKDSNGHVGLVRDYNKGYLTVLFYDGQRAVCPADVTFL